MIKNKVPLIPLLCALAFTLMISGSAVYATDATTITGIVFHDGTLIAEGGKEYVIADNEMGNQLIAEETGERVFIEGRLKKEMGKNIISVIVYKSLTKPRPGVSGE